MSELPHPSDTPRITLNVGTLSGLDVLTFGKIAPGATVKLKNGSTGQVISVKGRRITLRGVIPGSAEIRLDEDGSIANTSHGEIATVLREAQPLAVATAGDASPVSGSGVPRAAGA